jgi:hypothetical protein
MNDLVRALETSLLLSEKIASARSNNEGLSEKLAAVNFAAFGLFKAAAIDPAAWTALQKGLGFGIGVGLPLLGAGHVLAKDTRHQGEKLIRDARNQALLTAAGVGGMKSLGDLLKHKLSPSPVPSFDGASFGASDDQKLAAHVMVDDVLEAAYENLHDDNAKHAALVALVKHRNEGVELLRGLL